MKIFTIFTATFKSWIRSRTGVFFSFLFPLLLLLVFGTVLGGNSSASFALFVQNLDIKNGSQTQLSKIFIEALNNTKALNIISIPPEEEPKTFAKSQAGTFDTYRILLIPLGFEDATLNESTVVRITVIYDTLNQFLEKFANYIPPDQYENITMGRDLLNQTLQNMPLKPVNLTYIYDPSNQGSVIVKGILNSVANTFNYKLIGATEILNFTEDSFASKSFRPVDYYMPGYITSFIMTNGVIGLTANITEMKRRGIVKRLVSSPLRKLEWICGNILIQICIGLMLTAVMIAFAYFVFSVIAIPDVLSIVIILVGVIAFSGLGMLLGGIVKNVEASSALGNAIAFPMMFLSGSFWPLEIMPPVMQTIAKFLPLTYFSDALRNSMIYKDFVAAIFNLTVVAVLAIVFIVLGTLVTK